MTKVYYITTPGITEDGSALAYRLLFYVLEKDFGIVTPETAKLPCGKPYLRDYENVHFSISHTDSCIACVISEHPVGIDVQSVSDKVSVRITERLFTDNERSYVKDIPERFFDIWTRKESYAKLTGEGITHAVAKVDTLTGENTDGSLFVSIEIKDTAACLCMRARDSVSVIDMTGRI